jgi:hypothetical protein
MHRTTRSLPTIVRGPPSPLPALAILLLVAGCYTGSGTRNNSSGNEGSVAISYNVKVTLPVGGTVRSADGRIVCGTGGTACGPVAYPWGQDVSLTAIPDPTRRFLSWADDCSGSGTCTVGTAQYGADKTVVAIFPPLAVSPGVYFFVTVARPAGGTISSSDGTLHCGSGGSICGPAHFPWNGQVTLVATPDAGNTRVGWAGDCSGAGPCTLSSNPASDKSLSFVFADATGAIIPGPAPLLGGGGTCTPVTCRSGIDCGTVADGCGGTLSCGSSCVGTQTCGGSGVPSLCGGGTSTGLFLSGFFPVGVDGPIETDFALWSGRGMNTIVRGPPGPRGYSLATYEAYIEGWNVSNPGAPFRRIREPLPGWGAGTDSNGYDAVNVAASSPASDASIPYNSLLAWSQPDEPDINGGLAGNLTWLQQYSAKWRAADPKRPIYLNFGGNDFLVTGQNYAAAIASADWISNDVYPYTGLWWDPNNMGNPAVVGLILDAVSALTDKPKIQWIECGNASSQRFAEGPTGPQVRTMIWNAIIHGARGYVCWISDTDNGFNNSVTGAEGREISATNAWIGALSTVLQDQIIAPTQTGPNDAWGRGMIHVGGRRTSAGNFYIVQNVSNTTSFTGSIALPGAGVAAGATIYGQGPSWPDMADVSATTCSNCIVNDSITDTLEPNAVHVIQVR